MDLTNTDIRVGRTAIMVDGLPDCFRRRRHSRKDRKRLDRLFNTTLMDVNLNGDAYAFATDGEGDSWPRRHIDFDCAAWE